MIDWFIYAYVGIASLFSYFLGYLLAKRETRKTLQQIGKLTGEDVK